MSDLPDLAPQDRDYVEGYIERVFGEEHVRELIEFPDGRYRVLFDCSYFTLQPGRTAPSRSQWNTLKKRMKRVNPGVFVLKAYGEVPCQEDRCCYLEFGFFID